MNSSSRLGIRDPSAHNAPLANSIILSLDDVKILWTASETVAESLFDFHLVTITHEIALFTGIYVRLSVNLRAVD